jgi:hypothetical protein
MPSLLAGRYGAGMTVKLVVLYTQPDDPAAFEEHYLGVHMPLVMAADYQKIAPTGSRMFVQRLDE